MEEVKGQCVYSKQADLIQMGFTSWCQDEVRADVFRGPPRSQCSIEGNSLVLDQGEGETVDSGRVELVPMRRTLALLFSFRRLEVKQDLMSHRR